jgi:hypothetical protein
MRDLRVAAHVATLLGDDYVAALRAGPQPATVTCRHCGRRAVVDDGTPLAVIAAVRPGRIRVVFAHPDCEPSAVVDDTAPLAPTATTGATGRALRLDDRLPPVLAVTPTGTVHTRPGGPPGELADQVVAALLRGGLRLVPALDVDTLTALPHLPDWSVTLTAAGRGVQVHDPTGEALFDLQIVIGAAWLGAALAHQRILLLAGSMTGLSPAGLAAAAAAGRLTGATLPLRAAAAQ